MAFHRPQVEVLEPDGITMLHVKDPLYHNTSSLINKAALDIILPMVLRWSPSCVCRNMKK